jgi:predicted nucleotidyltransferase
MLEARRSRSRRKPVPTLVLRPHPTSYPDVNAVLLELLSEVRAILGSGFLGMYLWGSLAMGDFDNSSDIDALVLTTNALPEDVVCALAEMHERLSAAHPMWGVELEVSYIPRQAIRRYDPADDLHPYIGRGESLRLEEHGREWDIQRHIVRERGKVLAGPLPQTMIDPIDPDDMRRAVLTTLRESWARRFRDPIELHPGGYRSYIVLTGCRMLYTLEYGAVASKPVAARWAQHTLGARWATLVEWAVAARGDPHSSDQLENTSEAQEFVQYVIECAWRFELPKEATQGFEPE